MRSRSFPPPGTGVGEKFPSTSARPRVSISPYRAATCCAALVWLTLCAAQVQAQAPLPPVDDSAPVIVALGDSLTAGYGLAPEESYPSLLQVRLKKAGYPHRVVNAGVSGDTSAGGLARLDWVMQQPVAVLIVCLGANDGLRGLAPEAMRANLDAIVSRGHRAGAAVILAGMHMPTNYGPDYTRRFDAVFPEVAKKQGVPFLPFLLEGVAGKPGLNQADGIHPTATGTRIVEANVWKVLKPVLDGQRR
jgi:acyl-CoA thioesterase-1